MKVTVERSELLRSLGHVHRAVERRNTIPILANVLLRADRSTLSLKATDLDLEVTDAIAAEAAPGGSTTVPAHMFYDIVRKLPEGTQIVLESSGDRAALAIRAGRSRFTLQTLPESDFPDLAPGEMTHKFTLKASDLKSALATVSDAKAVPSGLLVDYHLDSGNGIEAIAALRWRFGAELPAILITADRSPAVREEARARDIQLLHKPLKPAALRALIAQWHVTRMAAAE